jgi:hypothetical protein
MVLGDPLLGGHIAEEGIGLTIITAHGGHGSTIAAICRSLTRGFSASS